MFTLALPLVAQVPPGIPVLSAVDQGNGLAAIRFAPPAATGGAPITGYVAKCTSGAASPALGGHGLGLDFINSSGSSAPVATSAFNSQSGSVIIASTGRGVLADYASAVVSDNKGNGNYIQSGPARPYTLYSSSGTALYYKLNAAGGGGHVVTASKPSDYDEVTVIAAEFRNVDTIVDSQWSEDLTSPNASASVTTTGPAALVAFWWGDDGLGELNPAADPNWTVLDHTSSIASNHVQGASAYRIVSGAGTYSITWTPSRSQGAQLWIVALQKSGGGGGATLTGSGTSSPVFVKGMSNGTAYDCAVAASNAVGQGAFSTTLPVTPSAATPFALVAVQSRKTHGAAGSFDLSIDAQAAAAQASVEPRLIGTGHAVVYQFNGPVNAPGSAAISPPGSATTGFAGNEVTVSATGVPDNSRPSLTLSNVNGAYSPGTIYVGFLAGDVSRNGRINAADIAALKARSGKTVDGGSFLFDVNLSGLIDANDTAIAKAASGSVLP